ncbi:MAG: hypothetical protein IKZ82_00195, partial [Clostridia bacterium]|nr:hypothetical protein [Clostridia bacterium]
TSIDVVDYYLSKEDDQKMHISVSADSLKIQLMSMMFIDEIRRELRKPKPIYEHVNFIEKKYTEILQNTVRKLSGLQTNEYKVSVELKAATCNLNQAIGLYLYILQAIGLVGFEQKSQYEEGHRSIRIKTALDRYKFLKELIETPMPSEFGRLNND